MGQALSVRRTETTAKRRRAGATRYDKTGGHRNRWPAVFTILPAAVFAATTVTAGVAVAEPGRLDSARSQSDRDRGDRDNTGWRHIDPRGHHHSDPDPRRSAEYRDNRRRYFDQQRESAETPPNSGEGTQTWTRQARPDGDGWTVCKPHAKFC
ncbi:hypothetical protein GCM10023318_35710 [Nocardia callitridis]|uniref:Secreted protein n=2 Tax=Nocardia callitridis TaxID=648753 RepID=A0ABP9KHJ8_9NOCA